MSLKKHLAMSLCALALSIGSFFGVPQEAEASDLYSTIYSNVAQYNGDATQCDWITNAILYASSNYGVDPILVASVMEVESHYRFDAFSPAGAVGLMQLMPGTASMIGVNPYDPLGNVVGGTLYLRQQLDNFSGWGAYSVTDAVAAYNAGPNAVYQYGGVPPYAETQNYVIAVNDAYLNLLNLSTYY